MSNYIAVKPSKVKLKKGVDVTLVTKELYIAIQEKCKSISEEVFEYPNGYAKIVPVVTIRTCYTNQVVTTPEGKAHREYTIKFDHAEKDLYSLSLLSCKQALQESLSIPVPPEELLQSSLAYPIGATYHSGTYYLLSHVVIDEKYLDLSLLAEGYALNDFSALPQSNPLDVVFNNKLITVKKEENANE